MGENQNNMEKKTDEVKVKVHTQHARILKEDDEIWISSEDLNTENSSDDDKSIKTKRAIKKKLMKLKNRKRSSPNIKLQRPSISSDVASTSKELDDRLLIPSSEDLHSRSTDDSRTSDEEYQIPSSSSVLPSECCLSKRLSLEDWRPMKGALNVSSLEDAVSATAEETRKIVNETGNFYNAMLYKLKSLKSCSAVGTVPPSKEKPDDAEKSFKYLKNTPEVRQKLDFINKLDEEISETISRYKAEREERLSTEFEMCKKINDKKLSEERGTEVFLQMCNFEEQLQKFRQQAHQNVEIEYSEENEHEDIIEEAESETNTIINNIDEENHNVTQTLNEEKKNNNYSYPSNFIRKNIYTAKEGAMAGFSLTDEEKTKIAEILKDIDDFQLDDAELSSSTPRLPTEPDIEESNTQNPLNLHLNAFSVPERDKIRMGQIDDELERFNEDKELNENINVKTVPVIKDEEFWKKYVLDQNLKEIDSKLEKLYASYIEDDEKLKLMCNEENEEEHEKDRPEEEQEELSLGFLDDTCTMST